jgi:lambda family phage portal protein
MSWLDKLIIAPLSPKWALERERSRRALKAYYEAAEPSRRRKGRTDRGSANAQTERSAERLRIMARHMEENLDIAKGALDVLCANVVGRGIRPEPQVMKKDGTPAKEVNDLLLKLFDDWRYKPEVTHTHDYYSAQRLACRSWLRDGEVLTQKIIGPAPLIDHGTLVPYSLELLEADYLPFDLNNPANGIVQGVEMNQWGRARAYWLHKQHPGDLNSASLETKRVSADRMIHLKLVNRLHQVRGITQFASVLTRFDDIKEIDESERVAARVAAAMAMYIKKGTPDQYVAPEAGNTYRTMEIAPGMIFDDLQPGEEVGTFNPNRPNNALIPFRDSQLRSASAGLGTSYSSLSKNYNGTYSAQRQELVEHSAHYGVLQSVFTHSWCDPTWWGFVDAATLSGRVRLDDSIDRESIYNVSHALPPMPWIDPLKELEAVKLAQEIGIKSRSRVIRERGDNPDQVYEEIRRDKEIDAELGLKPASPAKPEDDEPVPAE